MVEGQRGWIKDHKMKSNRQDPNPCSIHYIHVSLGKVLVLASIYTVPQGIRTCQRAKWGMGWVKG